MCTASGRCRRPGSLSRGSDRSYPQTRTCFLLAGIGCRRFVRSVAAARWERTERAQINCTFHGDDSIRIQDSAIANQFYRIAQEAVTNSIKHAAAKQIDICLTATDRDICLTITDDGVGFSANAQSNGVGLRLMRQGAALSGAGFDIRRNGKTGTIVTCRATNMLSEITS